MFGLLARAGDEWNYRAEWAHDEQQERLLVAAVIDAIHARLREDPAMHVYHYGHAEVSVLKRLCMLHAIREDELDQLLRRHVFVDLHQAVRQAMRIGLESYGLKKVEMLPGFVRTADVGRGADAVLEYEYYLASRDEQHLRAIESYNDEDCRSTVAVFDWLRGQAPGDVTWLTPGDGKEAEEEPHEPSERELLREELVAGEPEGSERWLAGELLAYHSRAAKQQWWSYFARREMTQEQLLADSEALAGLELRTRPRADPRQALARAPDVVPATGAQGLERLGDGGSRVRCRRHDSRPRRRCRPGLDQAGERQRRRSASRGDTGRPALDDRTPGRADARRGIGA